MNDYKSHHSRMIGLILLASLLITSLAPGSIHPVSASVPIILTVDTQTDSHTNTGCLETDDDDDCSLRGAIDLTNQPANLVNGYHIDIPAGLYPLNYNQPATAEDSNVTGDLDILNPHMELHGAGMLLTILDGNLTDRVIQYLRNDTGNLTITDLTIRNGRLLSGSGGGAGVYVTYNVNLELDRVKISGNISNGTNDSLDNGGGLFVSTGGNISIDHAIIQDNQACIGGGAYAANPTLGIYHSIFENNQATCHSGGLGMVDGRITINDTSFSYNSAPYGGAIFNNGTLTITDSTFAHNSATLEGGGALELLGSTTLTSVTLNNNSAVNAGGAIRLYNLPSTLTMNNVTITDNSATTGSAINCVGDGTLSMNHVTVAGNITPPDSGNSIITGINSHVSVSNSIFADANSGGSVHVCSISTPATWTSLGYNLSNDTSCNLTEPGDQTGVDPLVRPLGDFGGPTATMALMATSPAIDHANPDGCSSSDQRWLLRPIDGDNVPRAICDIGSFEFYPPSVWLPLVIRPLTY